MELRCVHRCHSKHLMVRRLLNAGGREFQTDDRESARLILYRSMRGRGGIKLFQPYLLVDLVTSGRMYSGVSQLDALNIITVYCIFSPDVILCGWLGSKHQKKD